MKPICYCKICQYHVNENNCNYYDDEDIVTIDENGICQGYNPKRNWG